MSKCMSRLSVVESIWSKLKVLQQRSSVFIHCSNLGYVVSSPHQKSEFGVRGSQTLLESSETVSMSSGKCIRPPVCSGVFNPKMLRSLQSRYAQESSIPGSLKIHVSKVERWKIPHQNFSEHQFFLESVEWARRTVENRMVTKSARWCTGGAKVPFRPPPSEDLCWRTLSGRVLYVR